MPPASSQSARPLVLIFGEDEFAVKQRAKEQFEQWSRESGGLSDEVIDGNATNADQALTALRQLHEALQTLPFFSPTKVVWLRDCNFLGVDDRVSTSQAVTEALGQLVETLKAFAWDGRVRLLVSAGKVDKRRSFYKTFDKLGTLEPLAGWSASDRDWAQQAELWARREFRARGKEIEESALAALVQAVGPQSRLMANEVEKLCLYVGDRPHITAADVATICTRNKTARAFALGDALGDRNLPELLQRLDEELWGVQLDRAKSEIGLVHGLISKVRAMILAREMVREGWVRADVNYGRFKEQLERLPADQLPADKRFNPQALHPFVLHRALQQSRNYTTAELVRAMQTLLECHRRLVSSNLEESLVLQQALTRIVGLPKRPARAA
ncbi:MAG: DNA polymerase III subunit delta [Verrucomicrobia bacterium]|nr:DNA polymerase III subunit delta [Verrucomicrobiota bacterium]